MSKRCKCEEIVRQINEEFPTADWNMDKACDAWRERCGELKDNHIEFEPFADENYGCTCPTCGRMICGWCV